MIRGKHLLSTANLIIRKFCWLTRIGEEFFQGRGHYQPIPEEEPVVDLEEPPEVDLEEPEEESNGFRAMLIANGNPMAVI